MDQSLPVPLYLRTIYEHVRNSPERAESIRQVCSAAAQSGLGQQHLELLLDLVLSFPPSSTLSTREKQQIIDGAIVPRACTISSTYISRILGLIGVVEVYREDKIIRKKRGLAPSLQQSLVRYLSRSLRDFGPSGLDQLRRSQTILFKYLSHKHVRPYIVRLICVALMQKPRRSLLSLASNKSKILPLKRWQVRYTVEMYLKHPNDPSLHDLLLFMDRFFPSLGVRAFFESESLRYHTEQRALGFESNPSRFPQSNTNIAAPSSPDLSLLAQRVITILEDPSSNFAILSDPKRTKFDHSEYIALALKCLDTSGGANHFRESIDTHVALTLRDDDLTAAELNDYCNSLVFYLSIGLDGSYLALVQKYILFDLDMNPLHLRDAAQHNFDQRVKLLPFLSLKHIQSLGSKFVAPMLNIAATIMTKDENLLCLCQLVHSIIRLLSIWRQCFDNSVPLFYSTCSSLLAQFWCFLESCSHKSVDYAFLLLVSFLNRLDLSEISYNFHDLGFVLPVPLVSRLVLGADAVVQSHVCGHIARCKKFKFKTEAQKALHKTYIMDSINLLWRDRAFYSVPVPQSPNQAFFLNPDLVDCLLKLSAFQSGAGTVETAGGLFENPAWCMILAQLIRKFEDARGTAINTRHAGPVTRESVLRLAEDSNATWLEWTFEEVKLEVLRELDRLGFDGFADLMFSSLKTLQNQRLPKSI